jgi:hypothetical protein
MSVGSNSDTPLVEREDEQRLLEAALARASDNRGGVVLGRHRLAALAGVHG